MVYERKKPDPFAGLKNTKVGPSRTDYEVETTRDRWLTGMSIRHKPTGLTVRWTESETLPRRLTHAEAYERLMGALRPMIEARMERLRGTTLRRAG